ncbi:MAG: hypothetical protein ABIH87_00140 [bacterium]
MNKTQLSKIMRLIRRTGDKLIIPDVESDAVMAMMNLDDYERLLSTPQSVKGLTEEQMMEKINRDIAIWRSQNQSETLDWYDGGDGYYQADKLYNGTGNGMEYDDRSYSGYQEDAKSKYNEPEIPFIGDESTDVEGYLDSDELDIGLELDQENDPPLYFEPGDDRDFELVTAEKMSDFGEISIEEPLNDIEDDTEDDKFYLEPIE